MSRSVTGHVLGDPVLGTAFDETQGMKDTDQIHRCIREKSLQYLQGSKENKRNIDSAAVIEIE
jgi:hypothetical protein